MFLITSLRLFFKRNFDKIKNPRVRLGILQAIPFWVASIIVGLVTVLYAKVFALAEQTMGKIYDWHHWIIFIQLPLFMLLAWWIVQKFAPYSRGSGIPQVMAATALIEENPKTNVEKLLSIKVAIVKVISTLFMALGGAAIGREGPTIQIAGSIFNYINKLIPKSWPKLNRTNMIVAGAAAGLAAAFNTPLGGIVFAVEELSRTHVSFYRTALFSGVIIAGLTAQAMLGPYLYLGFPDVSGTSWHILFSILLVAVIAGIAGSYLCSLIIKVIRWKARAFTKKSQHVCFVLGVAVIMAFLTFFISFSVTGSGKEIMLQLLFTNDKVLPWYTFPLRFVGSLLSFTSGAAGGVFAPGLAAGATIGASIGNWFHFQSADTNLLVLAGMVAFLTGITRTPFTSAILVLEMTDRHSVIFYLMLAGMIAGLASLLVDQHSFYDHLKHDFVRDFKRKEIEEQQKLVPAEEGG
ncbi:chloride channel protein [Ferruginibacter albus]|uniref:chloride channel protein n=1 Tax=Ferruginibacter albus TaxID=2875540 RepID=UPI001CC4A974|nr:chloride channel protein [Ferruginibacter albus]UAY52678.1 chloride channel protein [Ferruginibacter albus]